MTYNTYGHLFPERDAEITDRLEDLFRRAGVDSSWTLPRLPREHLQTQIASDLHFLLEPEVGFEPTTCSLRALSKSTVC